ncbi:hypothetical protein PybrP1_011363 [[Pythium] brassicae (nom. inval.)]|nr:hypothetical protein PybrP1_011363 [[Pythium] brassicae (nom. inval.)]
MAAPEPSQESAVIARLSADLQTADALLEALAAEASLFQRAMYKNQSQHRRAFFFQHLQHVKRCLRDLKPRDVAALVREAAAVLAQLQFAMTYFMPFALLMNAILARLALLAKALLVLAVEAHGVVALLYLHEVTKANQLRARVTAVQLQGYALPPAVVRLANV